MKNLSMLLTFFICSLGGFSQNMTCQLPPCIDTERAFSVLQEKFSLTAKQDLAFKQIDSNSQALTLSTEIRTFKLRHKTPRIGEFPQLRRPKWRKEKVQLKASLKDRNIVVTLNATAYNKRDKRWHPVRSTGRYEGTILQGAFTEILEGIQGSVIGSSMAKGPAGTVKLKNMELFTITGAYITFDGMKTLVIDLTDNRDATYKVSVPFLGNVDNICSAMKAFFSKFTTRNLKAEVPHTYDYYWAYAVEGEIMDGMHQNQVRAALGEPDEKIRVNKKTEQWIYHTGKSTRKLTIAGGELHIPENSD
ncbi:MAG: hypothetical protein CO090_09825 [Acidobacteria bacterium CG_4_9_14_3_um_filter_49_7]|nr:MAG: hypothetical protein CO090_09825 [Acidobacteria bacterium CG_4_9_14_3_um_filter_49_7]